MHQKPEISLPEETIERITAEELVRLQVRERLHANDRPDSRVLKFLNSAFGLFLLTSLFVSGLGGFFTYWNQKTKENEVRRGEEKKLLAEFDFRLSELDTRISEIARTSDLDVKGADTIYVYRAAMGSDFQPALPEYKNEHWAGIIIQLSSLGISENSAQAITATRDLTSGNYAGKGPGGLSFFAPGYLEDRAKTLHEYREAAWKKIFE